MEPKRTRRTFDPEFKIQAAARVVENKEKAAAVAQELDINPVSLYAWIKDYEKRKSLGFPAVTPSMPQAPSEASSSTHEPGKEERSARPPRMPLRPRFSSDENTADLARELTQVETSRPGDSAPQAAPAAGTQPEAFASAFGTQAEFALPELSPAAQQEASSAESEYTAQLSQRDDSRKGEGKDRRKDFREGRPGKEARDNREGRENRDRQNNRPNKDRPAEHAPFGFERSERAERDRNNPRGNNKFQKNQARMPQQSYEDLDEEYQLPAAPSIEDIRSRYPKPAASQGRSWKVMHALDQRPNYKEESAHFGYVDEFDLPAENLDEVWAILEHMQKGADKRAFEQMVHEKDLHVPPEVLSDPRSLSMQGPNVPNKPWLRKMRMNPIADDFFQTTPDYGRSVYENYEGLLIRLDKNSQGTPVLAIEKKPGGFKEITLDFSQFDRFVDDFYGNFVRDCKTVMMKQNPKEYPSLNAFIRIPDEPMWNPKLWAGVRTFEWKPDETLAEAWIRHAQNLRRNNRQKRYSTRADYYA